MPTMILTPYFSDSTNYLTFGHGLQVGNTFWLLTPLSAQDTGNSLQTLSLSLKTNIHFIKWVKVLRLRFSTCALRGFFWLLSHVIYLKVTRELHDCLRSQASIFEWWITVIPKKAIWHFGKIVLVNLSLKSFQA